LTPLRRKSSGIYYLDISHNGERIRESLGTKDKKIAKQLKRSKEVEIRERLILDKPKEKSIPLKSLINKFLNHEANWSNETREWYSIAIKSYFKNKTSINSSYAKAVNVFRNFCFKRGYKNNIPKQKGLKVYKERNRTFSSNELDLIFNTIEPLEFRKFIQFAYYTGARRGEICSMQREFITRGFVIGKTGKRQLKINSQARKFIDLENLWNYKKGYVSQTFKKNMRRLGIKDAEFHDLRRTFGLNLIKKGIPIYQVSKLLGHKSVTITEKHYAPLLVEDIEDFTL
tara:strand:+ start:1528 stop:2385 length:858 start_codon:yes stop_codon:yes gene_type:complete